MAAQRKAWTKWCKAERKIGDSTNASVDWPLRIHVATWCPESNCDAAPNTCSITNSGGGDFEINPVEINLNADNNSADINMTLGRKIPFRYFRGSITECKHNVHAAMSFDEEGCNNNTKVMACDGFLGCSALRTSSLVLGITHVCVVIPQSAADHKPNHAWALP